MIRFAHDSKSCNISIAKVGLECFFRYWYHILYHKNKGFITKANTISGKTAFITKKTVKRSIVNYTKCFLEQRA